ncbi:TPA: DNA polymerase III subunit alpha [Legionella pneumophila]|nr:DNA polymerase III subunit alpha [Legionella pneumophila]HAT8867879.1 DNA polymerase III subunit alpha [Legionella pneumophila subsp. pneumophila]HAT7072052.1 DNA polymerase III subunit alpha [Legionella pneumophila]HAT8642013.1 DNA polymerase III subunit alpha [Legionella pneumophila]HAT8890022.1 DNA polymerase III subunit alpha [Legionella pneumophila subsp. pneumophila]HAT8932327.1 DNA polymerase III subunit alpha [Legionella pneumophila subsp. pneumophila]
MRQRFVHLRVHTEFSLVDGLVQIKPLMKALPARGMSTVAVTDFCNLFAAVKVFKSATEAGIKPIIGSDLPCHDLETPDNIFSLVLLCQDTAGYKNLTCLVSKAYQEGQYHGQPRVQLQWIPEFSQGLIALSGGKFGDIGQALLANDDSLARKRALHWMNLFPNRFYLEIQRTGRADELHYNEKLVALADELQLPLVATNDVRFINEDDFDAHEARVCIHEGYTLADPRRAEQYSSQQYLRSADEMELLFSDLPSALQNTVEISKRCNVKLDLGHNYLPNFPIPDGTTVEAYLSHLSEIGLEERLKQLFRDKSEGELLAARGEYDKRLKIELDVINNMGFAGYFLIVADFIQWAKKNGVPVGPGRGSGAGSLVAYALKITDLDPLEYELLFERFLNPERVSMPDFDIDFCMEGRDRVIEYVAEKYGRQSVSQIITFGTMAAKAVVRDVGRVLGHPYGFVDKLAKLIPFELGITLSKAMEQEEELRRRYEEEEEVKELFDLALKLEGITRNAGKHAGGVVIAPSQLTDFTAIYCEEGSTQIVSQFDKDDVEAVGLVKFDFLGLRTLTIIDWALATVNKQCENAGLSPIDISQIPTSDESTFELLKACKTTAVFQLESRGMKELISRLQPDCFEDIIALVALFRPGPLQSGMVDDFIDRKHGRARVDYPHPDLEPILKPTYGVILYQEQVMQIAQVLANYTLGSADLLRRAMGKKKPEEMAKQREIFTQGAVARGVDEQVATHIFDLMEKFAGYGFNKSHSAAYALVAYQTAWLKAHYPAAFMAAVMSSDMDNTDKVVTFIDECAHMKLQVLPPSINNSMYHFTVSDEKTIIYGLGAIKGVGESAIDCIVQERNQNGPFLDLFGFCQRLDLRKVNRRVIEALIKSGAFDIWKVERAVLTASLEKALKVAEKEHQNQSSGQFDLFSLLEDKADEQNYVESKSWSEAQRLEGEREVLGFYLTGHPADRYRRELGDFIVPVSQLNPSLHKKAIICAQVVAIRKIITKRGKKLVIIGMDDATARIDAVVFGEIFEQYSDSLATGNMLVIEGEVAMDDYNGGVKMTANQLLSIASARTKFARCLELGLNQNNAAVLPSIQSLLKTYSGRCSVQLAYANGVAKANLNLGQQWCVTPSDELIGLLSNLLGEEQVIMRY